MHCPLDIACGLRFEPDAVREFLCSLAGFVPQRTIEFLEFLLPDRLLEGIRNRDVRAGHSLRCDLPPCLLGNRVDFVSH